MIKIALCDDENYFLDNLEKMIYSYGQENDTLFSVTKYSSSIYLMDSLKNDYQIFFLDIQMPNMDGIELANVIRKYDSETYLVFITSFGEYMPMGYELNASNYLEKPVSQSVINHELDRALNWLNSIRNAYLPVKNSEGFFKVYLHELIYIETHERNVQLHTEKGDITSYRKMQDLEKDLKGYPFFRCHTSYIVNLDYIHHITNLDVYLINGEKIFVSKAKKKELIKQMAVEMGSVGNGIL